MNITDKITITNEDCMELLKRTPDKYFDLAIVDPPYVLGGNSFVTKTKAFRVSQFSGRLDKGNNGFSIGNRPNKKYFEELFRISKNQIIWGGNYFTENLPPSDCWLVWDKKRYNEKLRFGMHELAYTSFNTRGLIFSKWNSPSDRIHPTQKPIALYKWLLDKYAKQGDKILDTHLGSGSIAIACHDYGFDLTACELDKEYYDAAIQRVKNHVKQQRLF